MIKRMLITVCCVAAAFISGCATAPQIPPELQYSPPPAGVTVAKIKGSEEKSALLDNLTAFILSVDGKRVMAGRKGWDSPLSIEAGHHSFGLEFNRGVFVARAEFELDAVAGAVYEVKYATDVGFTGNNSYVDFWIIDTSTGKAVTAIKRGSVGGGGGGAFIPIFIPSR